MSNLQLKKIERLSTICQIIDKKISDIPEQRVVINGRTYLKLNALTLDTLLGLQQAGIIVLANTRHNYMLIDVTVKQPYSLSFFWVCAIPVIFYVAYYTAYCHVTQDHCLVNGMDPLYDAFHRLTRLV
jgi:hypothetical protein